MPNPGGQPCSSRDSFSRFIVLGLFTYLFCLGYPVGLLSIEILLAKEDYRLSFCLRHFECSVPLVPYQLHKVCHSTARQNSRAKFILIQTQANSTRITDTSGMRLLAQEMKLWILAWLSKALLFILYHILKQMSCPKQKRECHLLLSYCWCLKRPSKPGGQSRCISTFKSLLMGRPKELNATFPCSSQDTREECWNSGTWWSMTKFQWLHGLSCQLSQPSP